MSSLFCGYISRLLSKIIFIMLVLFLLTGCIDKPFPTPQGTSVSWDEDISSLFDSYRSQQEDQKGWIEFKIELDKKNYNTDKEIKIFAKLTNLTNKEIVIRKVTALPTKKANYDSGTEGLYFSITQQDQDTPIEFVDYLDLVEYGFPPISAFVVLPPRKTYSELLNLPPLEQPLPVGKYNMRLMYRNQMIGAQDDAKYFVNFGAWLGETRSNIVTFEIYDD